MPHGKSRDFVQFLVILVQISLLCYTCWLSSNKMVQFGILFSWLLLCQFHDRYTNSNAHWYGFWDRTSCSISFMLLHDIISISNRYHWNVCQFHYRPGYLTFKELLPHIFVKSVFNITWEHDWKALFYTELTNILVMWRRGPEEPNIALMILFLGVSPCQGDKELNYECLCALGTLLYWFRDRWYRPI